MRDLTFSGVKAHPLAVAIMFLLAMAVLLYGWFDTSFYLYQQSSLDFVNFKQQLSDTQTGRGYLLAACFTLLLALYSVLQLQQHIIYKLISYCSAALLVAAAVFSVGLLLL
ncbi:hypothetical protein [Motilimonas pumila]|uniref:Uncharacterized protein n=1 Tax=Motilimonas pumila TaxID=2303987 RepID=A0A418YCH0_9GAMM|nr:hypothetical protein [Motilimonas pumila]RJG42179.1 hypothetical protein D1Z90_14645 [Motilimonas pumila]